jgi:hypothetical protein
MGLNRFKFYLLLEDNTIKSIIRNKFKPPQKYRGRRVIFAVNHLEDINMLRITLRSALIG